MKKVLCAIDNGLVTLREAASNKKLKKVKQNYIGIFTKIKVSDFLKLKL